MKVGSAAGFVIKVLIFLTAFAFVIFFNAYVNPAMSINSRFWFRTGDYFSLILVFAETFILGKIFDTLLIWTFKLQFERPALNPLRRRQ